MYTTMKKYMYILTTAMLLCMVGCRSNNNEPTVTVDWRVAPQAVNTSSSMNIIAAVNHDVLPDDRLAAFCEGQCVGVCAPVDTDFGARFFLCIFQPLEPSLPISLSYYSAQEQRVYSCEDQILFTGDAVLGLAGEPYWLTIKK